MQTKDNTPSIFPANKQMQEKYAHLYTPLPNVNFKTQDGVSWVVHRGWKPSK